MINTFKVILLAPLLLLSFPLFALDYDRPAPDGIIFEYKRGTDFVTVSWGHLSSVNGCENITVYYSVDKIESSYPLRKSKTDPCDVSTMNISGLEVGSYYFWAKQVWIEGVCEWDDVEDDEICDDEYFESTTTSPQQVLVIPNLNSKAGFEGGLGMFTNVGPYNWLNHSGTTPSNKTGPYRASEGTYYAYMETSSGYAYNSGNQAILESSTLNGNGDYYLSFKYSMYGSDMGTLYVDVFRNNSWINVWQKTGAQTGYYNWKEAGLYLTNVQKIRFRGVAKGGYLGDMAIDDVRLWSTSSSNKRVRFIHTDVLGSPIAETDENGNAQ